MNVEDVELGCYGLENEGWFDPWALLTLFKKRAIELGTEYVNAEAVNFEFKEHADMRVSGLDERYQGLDKLVVSNIISIIS